MLPNGINDFDKALACYTDPGNAAADECLVYDVAGEGTCYGDCSGECDDADCDVDWRDLSIGDNSLHVVLGNISADSGDDLLTADDLIDGFIIKHSYSDGGANTKNGGGFHNTGGSPSINDCIFVENLAIGSGGGVYSNGSITITNCDFIDNRSAVESSFQGGAIALEGSVTAPDVITDCTFTGNVCAGHGGAISYVTPSHDLEVTDCTFTGNDARGTGGGAIWIEGDATITGSTFTTNLASASGATIGRGGAIVMMSGDSLVSGCTFTTNDAAGDGGRAIYYRRY